MLWTDSDWLEPAEKWIRDQLGLLNIQVTGPIEQPHVREWGTILRVPTNKGDVYFKATTLLLQNEAAVTQALSNWHPDLLPRLYAADIKQNWMLVADGGLRLRDAFNDGLAIDAWSDVLRAYAAFQIDLSERVEKLMTLTSPDRRLHKLPSLFEGLMADTGWLMIGHPDGLTQEEYERLVAGLPYIERLCRELAAYKIPASLHHGDLHDGNIFMKDGRHLFFDWGDSHITHPFFSLRTVFVSMENTFGYEENDPRFDDFARDYLEPWQKFESRERLWNAYQIANRLWSIPSALQWKFVMSQLPGVRREMAHAVPGLLQEVLEANPEM
jgi:hypothetical protein